MKNLLKLSAIAILAASAVSTFASNKEPYTEQGTNAREMTEQVKGAVCRESSFTP